MSEMCGILNLPSGGGAPCPQTETRGHPWLRGRRGCWPHGCSGSVSFKVDFWVLLLNEMQPPVQGEGTVCFPSRKPSIFPVVLGDRWLSLSPSSASQCLLCPLPIPGPWLLWEAVGTAGPSRGKGQGPWPRLLAPLATCPWPSHPPRMGGVPPGAAEPLARHLGFRSTGTPCPGRKGTKRNEKGER